MWKEYNLHDYKTISSLEADMLKDLNADFADLEITSPNYTDCEILEITGFTTINNERDVVVDVSCNAGIKSFCFRTCANNGRLILPEDKKVLLTEYMTKYDAAYNNFKDEIEASRKSWDEKAAEGYKAYLAEQKAKALERKAQEEKIKLEKKIKKSQEDFEKKITAWVKVDKDPIDWLKENVVSVTATIPNHLEKIFVKEFGNVPHKVVDSSRKTSGGYSMKFGPSFMLTVKKDTPIHPALEHLFKDNKLRDTSFIAKLVRDGELSFGKSE